MNISLILNIACSKFFRVVYRHHQLLVALRDVHRTEATTTHLARIEHHQDSGKAVIPL